jgi:hypothetical protein
VLNSPRVAGCGAGAEKDGISSKAGAKEGGGWKGAGAGAANKLGAGLISGAGEKAGAGAANRLGAGLVSGAGEKAGAGCCGVGAWPSNWALLKPDSVGALAAKGPEEEAKGSKGLAVPAKGELG